MTAFTERLLATLAWSTLLMAFLLVTRGRVRQWIGPRLGYAMWALPAMRMVAPLLPTQPLGALPALASVRQGMTVIAVGGGNRALRLGSPPDWTLGSYLLAIWLVGAVALLMVHTVGHVRFCRRLIASGEHVERRGSTAVVASDVAGPVAFGVLRRYVAVPRAFACRYNKMEQDLALTHECAHHLRGDLLANWASLIVLAAHWWNPVAWKAIRAFREDQELAVDAHVLARHGSGVRSTYAHVLAKAAGISSMPACNLTAQSDLPKRLRELGQASMPRWRSRLGSYCIALGATATLAVSLPVASAVSIQTTRQVSTIGVQPDGTGNYHLVVGGTAVAPDAPMPAGAILPSDLNASAGCDLRPSAKPRAMVIKGGGNIAPYTIMCGRAGPAPARTTLIEGLASLEALRASVAAQQQPSFPESERQYALHAIDRSIREVADLLNIPNP